MRLLMLSGDRLSSLGEKGPFWTLQREFSKHFERIDVLSPRPDGEPVVKVLFDNVFLHPAEAGRAGMLGYLTRRGEELLREHEHALVISHDYGWFYNGLAAARLSRRTGTPYLSEIHHVPGVPVAADWREVFDRFVAKRYVRWARSRAAAFRVVNAGEMPGLLVSWGVPREQVRVLHSLYMDLEVFRPVEPRPEPVQDVVFVGRLVNNKGLDRIVQALSLSAGRGRPLRALIVGSGPMEGAVRAQVRAAGLEENVRFVSWVGEASDLARVYRESRLCVCASTCEGGPRFTVEAMACGTPVVSTRVGIMTELLDEGRGGLLVDFTAEDLLRAWEALLGDPERWSRASAEARLQAERFEYADVIGRYARGVQELARELGRGDGPGGAGGAGA